MNNTPTRDLPVDAPAPANDQDLVKLTELAARRGNDDRFVPIAELRDRDGVLAVVTERTSDGRISFALFREFEVNGTTQKSAFLAHRHIEGAIRVLRELDRHLELMEDRSRAARRIADR